MINKEILLSNHQSIGAGFSLDGSHPLFVLPVIDDNRARNVDPDDFLVIRRNTGLLSRVVVAKLVGVEPLLFPDPNPAPLNFKGGHEVLSLESENGDTIHDYELKIFPFIFMDGQTEDAIVGIPLKEKEEIIQAIRNFAPVCIFSPNKYLIMTSPAHKNVALFGMYKNAAFTPPFGEKDQEEQNGQWQKENGIAFRMDIINSPKFFEQQHVAYRGWKMLVVTSGIAFHTHDFNAMNAILDTYVREKDYIHRYLQDIVHPYCKVEILSRPLRSFSSMRRK